MAHRTTGFIDTPIDRGGSREQSALLDSLSGGPGKNAARTAPSTSHAICEQAGAR